VIVLFLNCGSSVFLWFIDTLISFGVCELVGVLLGFLDLLCVVLGAFYIYIYIYRYYFLSSFGLLLVPLSVGGIFFSLLCFGMVCGFVAPLASPSSPANASTC